MFKLERFLLLPSLKIFLILVKMLEKSLLLRYDDEEGRTARCAGKNNFLSSNVFIGRASRVFARISRVSE